MPRNHKKRRRKPWLKYARVNPSGAVTFGLGMGGRFDMRKWPGECPPPALGTVRKWLRDGEAAGVCERRRGESAGKPGRPPDLRQLTEKGRQLKRRQRAERMPES